jgi:dipeptidyl aminopeptidase/acylaminoacyl peptidase
VGHLRRSFTAVAPETRWDVENFDISDDGRFIAYVVNEAGISRLKLLDTRTRRSRAVTGIPVGTIGGLEVAPWGDIAATVNSARSPADVYVVNPRTLAVTRWTESETGGLDPRRNVEPVLVETTSFDGEKVSGFLYRPDPARFPGRRPMIMSIHGGPEGQSRPGFLGRNNYLVNELGIALFYPNVRGSTGFGKRFVALDNGPDLRENSVKDVGAFLDVLARDPSLDPARFAETGGSYGGYMCYASAIRYGDRFKAANCIVAISNFVTFLENTQSYRRDLRRVEYGDERDPVQRKKLLAISPLTRIKELRLPLMVQTGGNDPRVPASEAEQAVKAVRRNGGTAWHLLAQDEGHGFAKKANQDYAFWASLMFWQRHLLDERPRKGTD